MPKHIIYCWTGTGNSLDAAKTIAAALGGAELRPMRGEIEQDVETVGFVYPTYYWMAPAPVTEFIRKAKLPKGAYYYAVTTYGAILGNALADVDRLLRERGEQLSYYADLKHVASYIAIYEPFPDRTVRVPEAAEHMKSIAAAIAAREVLPGCRGTMPGFVPWVFHAATSWGNFGLRFDKGYRVADTCISCGLCARVCPVDNIVMEGGKPTFLHHCEHCMACFQFCPKEAVNYGNRTQKRKRYHHPNVTANEVAGLLGK